MRSLSPNNFFLWFVICDHYEVRSTYHKHATFFQRRYNSCCIAFSWCIPAFGINAKSAAGKYQALAFRTADWSFFQWCMNNASAGKGSRFPLCSSLERGRLLDLFWMNITCLECWNASLRLLFHAKCESRLTRLWKRIMNGPSEYAQATCLTSPNHELASVSVFRIGKFNIASMMDSEGVIPEGVIWRSLNCTMSWKNWNFDRIMHMEKIHMKKHEKRLMKNILFSEYLKIIHMKKYEKTWKKCPWKNTRKFTWKILYT